MPIGQDKQAQQDITTLTHRSAFYNTRATQRRLQHVHASPTAREKRLTTPPMKNHLCAAAFGRNRDAGPPAPTADASPRSLANR